MKTTSLLFLSLLSGQPQDRPGELIEEHFRKHWQAEKITPSVAASDHAFLRRASLDLIGRVPTRAEREAFFKDPAKIRRARLIDRLLDDADYAHHWGNIWADWLLGARDDPAVKAALQDWLRRHLAMGGSHKLMAKRLITATGSTRDNPAVFWIVAHRGESFAKKKWAEYGQFDMNALTNLSSRLFLGKRVQCVQCHDHPFGTDLRQDHFHALNGFFRQVSFRDLEIGKERHVEVGDDPKLHERGIMFYERRNGVIRFTVPRYFDGAKWDAKSKQTRRQFLADQVVQDPYFARAYVHRIWGYLFNYSLTGYPDADDLGDHCPESYHSDVVNRLAKEFVKSEYDPKAIFRIMCTSEAYGLSSVANKTNAGSDKAMHFGVRQVRPLSPEQFVDSLIVVLRPKLERDARAVLSRSWLNEFQGLSRQPPSHCDAENLGAPAGFSSDQVFWVMNSKTIHRALTEDNAVVAQALRQKTVEAALDYLFLAAVGRPPTATESKALSNPKAARLAKQVDLTRIDMRRGYYEDILWGLLNSAEFATNH
jgi:hypothetical protein